MVKDTLKQSCTATFSLHLIQGSHTKVPVLYDADLRHI